MILCVRPDTNMLFFQSENGGEINRYTLRTNTPKAESSHKASTLGIGGSTPSCAYSRIPTRTLCWQTPHTTCLSTPLCCCWAAGKCQLLSALTWVTSQGYVCREQS